MKESFAAQPFPEQVVGGRLPLGGNAGVGPPPQIDMDDWSDA